MKMSDKERLLVEEVEHAIKTWRRKNDLEPPGFNTATVWSLCRIIRKLEREIERK